MFAFFSCSDGNRQSKNAGDTTRDTTVKANSSRRDSVNSQRSNTVNPGRDTTLRYKQAIKNDGPDQARTDSIKRALTKKKK
jgi:hypothetical protein